MKKKLLFSTLLLALIAICTPSCDLLFDLLDDEGGDENTTTASGVQMGQLSKLSFGAKLTTKVKRTWNFDGGGTLNTTDDMYYNYTHNLTITERKQTGSTVTIKGEFDIAEPDRGNDGDHTYRTTGEIAIEISNFAEPFDKCYVKSVKCSAKQIGKPLSSTQLWQESEYNESFTLSNIPVSFKPVISGSSGEATISFTCKQDVFKVNSFTAKRVNKMSGGSGFDQYDYTYQGDAYGRDYAEMSITFKYTKN